MLKQILGMGLAGLVVCASPAALAETYWGAMVQTTEFIPDGYEKLSYTSFSGRFGYETGFLGFEGRLGTSMSKDSGSYYGYESTQINYFGSGLVKLNLTMPDPRVKLYAVGGYSLADLEIGDNSETYDGLTFGGGIELYGTEKTALNLEYMRLLDDEDNGVDIEVNTFSLGIISHF